MNRLFAIALITVTAAACNQSSGDDNVVNIYSARHYDSDAYVYDAFTAETGIEVNLIEAGGDLLIERIRTDGERSPADVVITVDASRLQRAEEAGLFAQTDFSALADGVQAHVIDPDGYWAGFALRTRVIAYNRETVDPSEISSYLDLADPRWQGQICIRSSDNAYNQSLLASIIAHHGEQAGEAWARSVVANFARAPQGGDTDQIRAIGAGECDIAVVNHYYYLRLAHSGDPATVELTDRIGLIFPSGNTGTHVNISGVGIAANAPHGENAEAFVRFLFSPEAQRAYAEIANEFPAVTGAAYDNADLRAFDGFEADTLNISELGDNAETARRVFDRVGWP
ncbi:extracellular solute-binding protein [Hyphobacterium sp. HN65]|uniref:Extracellular solute-binding protein n=1 Tax=Hyphobacterium lacteum TaxID=3116575 RepID=A0ABU7LT37_9PROT|nr:extracellular solute-binding protein [Hyphobacterium sp. HN65]MEE2527090.1 extracellular solute-binding protein [Hyphobacterium sp. HN65]